MSRPQIRTDPPESGQGEWVDRLGRPDGSAAIYNVDPLTRTDESTVGVSATQFAAAEALHTVPLRFDVGSRGVIETVRLFEDSNTPQSASTDLFLFNAPIDDATENAAFNPSDADMAKCIGVVPITSYATAANSGIGTARAVGLAYDTRGSEAIYGIAVTRGTPTYAINGVRISLTVLVG